ncbi:MAG: tRNA lysidine(34) synthetase TilS [Tannerella sp.]|nr:tRNA lysidine(34) synthetase TilS [Tannerella sp.]
MLRRLQDFIERRHLLKPEGEVVVGVSGGADSVALLNLLILSGYKCVAAHCNFHLRGEESDGDEEFVRRTAEKLQIPFYKTDFDTVAYAKSRRMSVEMAARELRYEWFENLRQERKAQAIAVAHHRDDSIETVLLNLIRGTGIRGLTGINPVNGFVVRPLIPFSKNEIIQWLDDNHLTYRTDSSNLSDNYDRNFIRIHLLPLMTQLNPSVNEAVIRTAENLAGAELLFNQAINIERARVMTSAETVNIERLKQSSAPQTVLYELLRPYGFNRTTAEAIANALDGATGKIFYAAETGYRIVKDRENLIIMPPEQTDETFFSLNDSDQLAEPIRLSTEKRQITANFSIGKEKTTAYLDYSKLTFPLTLRRWRRGDRFVPFGMKGGKKLSDYFNDHKYSKLRKEQTWLLCNGDDIIWIVGERIDERYKIEKKSKIAFIVKFLA